jgi:hypothetical protein
MSACLDIRGWQAPPGYRWRLAWIFGAGGTHQDTAGGLPRYQRLADPTRIQRRLAWTKEAGGPHQNTEGCLPGYQRLTGLTRIQMAACLDIRV